MFEYFSLRKDKRKTASTHSVKPIKPKNKSINSGGIFLNSLTSVFFVNFNFKAARHMMGLQQVCALITFQYFQLIQKSESFKLCQIPSGKLCRRPRKEVKQGRGGSPSFITRNSSISGDVSVLGELTLNDGVTCSVEASLSIPQLCQFCIGAKR